MEVQVILRKDVEKLGRVGDVVKVRAGYARNYLLPQGIAYPVSPDNIKRIQAEKERARQEEERRLEEIKSFGEKLASTSVTIEAKAEEGRLFGSVTAQMVADALKEERGLEVPAKAVKLEHPLKEIGVYDVPIHLHPGVEVNLKVWVVEAR